MRASNMLEQLSSFFNVSRGRASFEAIRDRVRDGAMIDGMHMLQLIAAMLIASIGLNVDSTEAVIGAMLICPLMGSVLAIACAVASLDKPWLREAVWGLFLQTIVCLITSTVYFVVSPLSHATTELLSNSSPTIWDVMIALVGGFAGALGTSRRDTPSTLVAGVAVATALMPPLCATGYGFAARNLTLAASAFYEYLINVVFIGFGANIVLVALGMPLNRDLNGDGVVTEDEARTAETESRSVRHRVIAGSLLFALPCLFFTTQVVKSHVEENGSLFKVQDTYDVERTTAVLKVVCPEVVGYRIGEQDSYDEEADTIVRNVNAVVESSSELADEEQAELERLVRINVEEVNDVSFQVADDKDVRMGERHASAAEGSGS